MLTGDGLGDGGQRPVDNALELEALRQHLDVQSLALVRARDDRAGQRRTQGLDLVADFGDRWQARYRRDQASLLLTHFGNAFCSSFTPE